ncbi:MAG: hypothetical protein BJ554DRAFT_7014 [Olpidium bornovanus]|uniref:Uncharacterized protein n=1 Tax=Olpidium bornovanus TaxID=278681 RepID=A0A8H7ZX56_9FUNG|nr:MAG: hypothetical protein BJ554DRAFT_7014 [Olpidium bornovanus]
MCFLINFLIFPFFCFVFYFSFFFVRFFLPFKFTKNGDGQPLQRNRCGLPIQITHGWGGKNAGNKAGRESGGGNRKTALIKKNHRRVGFGEISMF